ncbi:AAEL012921-PA [Aedes aegypti]|uniref:Large ribosomal subunit protein eL36 n=1 Tax=Aedes aegypti TaxID=7159 RepID=Q16KP4_AEDAE|nr:AAEL012921-PA [Aedes aegypti]
MCDYLDLNTNRHKLGNKSYKLRQIQYREDRLSRTNEIQTKLTKLVRDLIHEVVVHATFKKKDMQLLKVFQDKLALRFMSGPSHIRA